MKTVKQITHEIQQQGKAHSVQTLIEAVGTQRVLVEHHHGIIGYGSEEIRVGATFGDVCISGSGLQLCCMNREQLFISGQIRSISLECGGN